MLFLSIFLKDSSEQSIFNLVLRIWFHMITPWYLIPVWHKLESFGGTCKLNDVLESFMFMNLVIIHKETLKYISKFFMIHIIHEFSDKVNIDVLGPHKFSLQATIDHHGPSMYSGHYTASINCCKRTFYCNDSKITEFETIDTKNSTAYVVMYRLIT